MILKTVSKMEFTKEFLLCVIFEDFGTEDEIKIISNEIVDQRRWLTEHKLIFKYQNKFYKIYYDAPSTEGQDGCGYFEYNNDEDLIEIDEVFPVEKTIIVYE